jgi:hypothetical protein
MDIVWAAVVDHLDGWVSDELVPVGVCPRVAVPFGRCLDGTLIAARDRGKARPCRRRKNHVRQRF